MLLQGAKKRLDFPEGKRPATASDIGRLQQEEADSECSGSVASRATGRGQELYERGMEMKLRQQQIRDQLKQVTFWAHRKTLLACMHMLLDVSSYTDGSCPDLIVMPYVQVLSAVGTA